MFQANNRHFKPFILYDCILQLDPLPIASALWLYSWPCLSLLLLSGQGRIAQEVNTSTQHQAHAIYLPNHPHLARGCTNTPHNHDKKSLSTIWNKTISFSNSHGSVLQVDSPVVQEASCTLDPWEVDCNYDMTVLSSPFLLFLLLLLLLML